LAVDAAQPEMEETAGRCEHRGFLAGGNTGVPGAKFEMSAAKEVVSFRGGRGVDLLLEGLKRLIDAAGGEEIWRSLSGSDGGQDKSQEAYEEASQMRWLKNRFLTGLGARFGMTRISFAAGYLPVHSFQGTTLAR